MSRIRRPEPSTSEFRKDLRKETPSVKDGDTLLCGIHVRSWSSTHTHVMKSTRASIRQPRTVARGHHTHINKRCFNDNAAPASYSQSGSRMFYRGRRPLATVGVASLAKHVRPRFRCWLDTETASVATSPPDTRCPLTCAWNGRITILPTIITSS